MLPSKSQINCRDKLVMQGVRKQFSYPALNAATFSACGLVMGYAWADAQIWLFLGSLILLSWYTRITHRRYGWLWSIICGIILQQTFVRSQLTANYQLNLYKGQMIPVQLTVVDPKANGVDFGWRKFFITAVKLPNGASVQALCAAPPHAKWSKNDRLSGKAQLTHLPAPRFPGSFDYAKYLNRQLVFLQLNFVEDPKLTPASGFKNWRRIMTEHREAIAYHLSKGLDRFSHEDGENRSGLLNAMILGMREDLTYGQSLRFRKSGLLHLFAISGMHTGIIALILIQLLRFSGLRYRYRFISLPILTGIYIIMTGLPPSAIRAWLMITCWCIGKIIKRPVSHWQSLGLAAVVLLVIQPLQSLSIGFWYSFGAVGALIAGTEWAVRLEIGLGRIFYMQEQLSHRISAYQAFFKLFLQFFVPAFTLTCTVSLLQFLFQGYCQPAMILWCFLIAGFATIIFTAACFKLLLALLFSVPAWLNGFIDSGLDLLDEFSRFSGFQAYYPDITDFMAILAILLVTALVLDAQQCRTAVLLPILTWGLMLAIHLDHEPTILPATQRITPQIAKITQIPPNPARQFSQQLEQLGIKQLILDLPPSDYFRQTLKNRGIQIIDYPTAVINWPLTNGRDLKTEKWQNRQKSRLF